MRKAIIAYVPVVHAGYVRFFSKHDGEIAIIDPKMPGLPEYLARDMRAISPNLARSMIFSMFNGSRDVLEVSAELLNAYKEKRYQIVMPREDVSIALAERYLSSVEVEFDDIFLRWNWQNLEHEKKVSANRSVDSDQVLQDLMITAFEVANRSHDWWRQVGAILVRDGKILAQSCNRHMPSEQTHNIVGDPRIPFKPGERTDLSSAQHAERVVIASAAKQGICTDGVSIFVTTFPCPACAMDIVEAGISQVYFCEGYSLLGAEEIFRSHSVEIIHVNITSVS